MKYIESSQVPEGEKVYLKKDILGWRVVNPINNNDGSYNWFNLIFGSKSNVVFLIILSLLGLGLYFGINELIANYKLVADNPCDFCTNCFEQTRKVLDAMATKSIKPINFNFTG